MKRRLPPPANPCDFFKSFSRKNAFFCQIHTIIYMRPKQRRNNADRSRATKTVGESHLYRRLHLFPGHAEKKLCLNPTTKSTRRAAPQLPSPTGVLGGRRGFAGAQPRLAKVAAPLATFRPKGRRSLPKQCWGSRSKHGVRSFQRRGGFRRDKRRDIAASCPLPSRGVVPS